MVAWWIFWLGSSLAMVGGFVIGAIICSGRMVDLEFDVAYWRGQCVEMAKRYKIDLPLGPDKGE